MQLRDYQQSFVDGVREQWNAGKKNVLGVMPCRSGKTVSFTSLSHNDPNPSCTIVHRQELIGQISETHAIIGIPHKIIAPQPVINFCIQKMIKKTGRSFYDPHAPAAVAGVDTLIRRFTPDDQWSKSVKRSTTDEAHHALTTNKWGKAINLFPNALGLGVTATPIRADYKSLSAEQGGMFHALVQGIGMRELINAGSICEYRVIAPAPSIDEAELTVGATGEFTDKSKKQAAEKSQIVGDAVKTYLEHVNGKSAIAFTVDVEQAVDLAKQFNDAGIPAVALDGNTPDNIRQDAMDDFQAGRIKVLTNCELFSEGLDLPGVDVCIMCRPTMSFGMFVQQFCRSLTPAPGKKFGIIIDHVGNVLRMAAKHGMPDTPRRWSLWLEKGAKQQSSPDAIPHRACEVCTLTYEAVQMACPFCGHIRQPDDRGIPEQVDGILREMSPELLHQLRTAKAEIFDDARIDHLPEVAKGAAIQRKARLQMAHNALKEAMEFWGGVQLAAGNTDEQMQARFLHRFGVDVMTAQTLNTNDAIALREEITKVLT